MKHREGYNKKDYFILVQHNIKVKKKSENFFSL